MIRYRYNQQLSPPAPFTHICLRHLDDDVVLEGLPAQVDTAADITVVPASLLEQLRAVQLDAMPIIAFGAVRSIVPTFLVKLSLPGRAPIVAEVLQGADEPHVLLGRDVLNQFRILLDGPRGLLEIE